jgi:hypothetical protein
MEGSSSRSQCIALILDYLRERLNDEDISLDHQLLGGGVAFAG